MLWRFAPACLVLFSLLISSSGFAASGDCGITGEEILSDLFVRPSESHLRKAVIEKKVVEGTSTHFPSASEFKQKYPFNLKKTSEKQTWVNYERNLFEIKNYDETQGRVLLSRNILKYETFPELLKTFPESKIKVGEILKINGEDYQVLGIDQFHLSKSDKVVHLGKRVTVSVPFSEIEGSLNSVHFEDLKQYLAAVREHSRNASSVIPFVEEQAKLVQSSQEKIVYRLGAPQKSPFKELNEELKIPENYILEVTKPDGSYVRVPLKEFTPEMEATAKSVEVYRPEGNELVANYQRLNKWGSTKNEFLNITPVKSNVYLFKVGEGKGSKQIMVRAPVSPIPGQDAKDLKKIEQLIAKIPKPLKNFVETIHFDPGASGQGLAASTTSATERQVVFYQKDPISVSVVSDILSRPHVGETFWHELGHHLQAEAATRIPNFNWTLWEDAMVKDRSWVTPYAMTLTSEDFPETLARYVRTDAGRLDPQSRKIFKHRFEILDRLFQSI